MNHYFVSDVHLRHDRPERAGRLAEFVSGLVADESLLILGDLCDFWMASRDSEDSLMRCAGLQALAGFRRRGGSLAIMPGNHDHWLCPFYERVLGAAILKDPTELTVHGLRLHLVHGHLLGARSRWKALMEGRGFFRAFGRVPAPLAGCLDQLLEFKNQHDLEEDERRHMRIYREYAAGLKGRADLVVIGHVHRPADDITSHPRLIVPGGWQRGSSYLRIGPDGATFRVVDSGEPAAGQPALIPPATALIDSRTSLP